MLTWLKSWFKREPRLILCSNHQWRIPVFEPDTGLLRYQCEVCGKVVWR